MSEDQFAALSIVGKGAVIVFILAWIYAAVSALALLPHRQRFNEQGLWQDAELRPKFVRFVSFCALGVLACLVGFTFGGWPRG